jgi:hypothetical protein
MRHYPGLLRLCSAVLLLAPALRVPFLGCKPLAAQSAPPVRVAASLKRVFGETTRVDSVWIDSALVLRVWRGDSLTGLARVRNVKGKDQPITYLVALDPDLRLRDVDILVYREAYGGEIAYEAWRKQFRGRGAEDPLEVGHDIRSISGATISVNAVTLGVRRTVAEFAAWRGAGRL